MVSVDLTLDNINGLLHLESMHLCGRSSSCYKGSVYIVEGGWGWGVGALVFRGVHPKQVFSKYEKLSCYLFLHARVLCKILDKPNLK